MSILFILVPIALLLAGGALLSFLLSAKSGQYEDLETPAYRILLDDCKSGEKPND